MSGGLTDWLRRRGEYPGPGVPAAPVPSVTVVKMSQAEYGAAAEHAMGGTGDDRAAELEAEIAALSRELIAVAHRNAELRRMVEASPEQVRRNCLALSDRLEQAQATIERLEAQTTRMRREADIFGAGGGRPSVYPPGVGYIPGRGPHGPSGHDGEYAGLCYCGYPPAECDAYAEAERLYGHRVGEVSP